MKKVFALTIIFVLFLAGTAFAASGDIVRITGNVEIGAGQVVNGDVVAIIGNVTVNGQVNGDVVSILGKTTLGPEGVIRGDAVSIIGGIDKGAGSAINGSAISIVGGGSSNIGRMPRHISGLNHNLRALYLLSPIGHGFSLLIGVLLAVVIAAVFPNALLRARSAIKTQTGPVLAFGFLTWIVAIPLIILAAITIIGIPAAILIGITLWVASQLGYAALALIVGSALLKENQQIVATVALGALLVGAVRLLPLPGIGFLGMVLGILTVGAAVVSHFGTVGETA